MPLEAELDDGARAIVRLCPAGPLVLALSGGGDSMALACLMADEAARSERDFHALIVDHRLRPESTDEAELAASHAEALGARTRVLVWDQPASGQAAARMARHRLLADAARDLGAGTVFLAHTADDVIETLLMRLSRKQAGWRALAAMGERAISPAWPEGRGIRVARPLVRTSRAALRRFLNSREQSWIEDTSNINRAFERVRARARAPSPDSEAGRRLLALNDAALLADAQVRRLARHRISKGARILPWGGLNLDARAFARPSQEVALRALEALIMAVSGVQSVPPPRAVSGMRQALLAGSAFTAAGVLLTREGALGRDPGAIAGRADGRVGVPPQIILPGTCAIFDGRLLVCAGSETLQVSALGRGDHPAVPVPARLRPSLVAIRGKSSTITAGLDAVPGEGAAGVLIAERVDGLLNVSADGTVT